MPRLSRILAGVLLASLLGCSIAPVPVTDAERDARRQADLARLYQNQEPVDHPISLAEATARALKYNLDHRSKMMELALAAGQLDVQRYDLLPSLAVSAGYDSRNNDSGGTSLSILSGQQSLEPSTSAPRAHSTSNAALTWNVLDFGLSYFQAREQANQVLIAEEQRRKVVQNIVQDVKFAWWRAASAQQLLPQLDALQNRIAFALDRSQRIEQQRLLPPLQALAFQRALLDIKHAVMQQRSQLVTARTELAALMNLRPGTVFTVAAPDPAPPPPQPLAGNLTHLETMALDDRPELREEDVRRRITAEEAHRALLGLLPGIQLSFTGNYDSNPLLYRNTWTDAGATLSVNLMKLFAWNATRRMGRAQVKVDDARRLALAAAILTQLHIACEHYHNNWIDYQTQTQAAAVDQRIADDVRSATRIDAGAELELIRVQAQALLSRVQRDVAYASLQSDYARILNSIGIDPVPASVKGTDLMSLAAAIENASRRTQAALSGRILAPAPAAAAIRLRFRPVAGAGRRQQAWVRKTFAAMAAGANITLVATGGRQYTLTSRLHVGKAEAGVRLATTDWLLHNAAGRIIGRYRFASYLAEPVDNTAWQAYMTADATAAASELVPRLLNSRLASRTDAAAR